MNTDMDSKPNIARSGTDKARRIVRQALGNETVNNLHKENPLLDFASVAVPVVLVIGIALLMGRIEFGLLWCLLFVAQGLLAQTMMLVSHDLFVHRRVGGDFWSWVGSMVLTIPRLSSPSGYESAHLNHHKYIGTDRDTEAYKQDLNTRFKRVLFSTMPGVKMAQANKFSDAKRKHYHDVTAVRPGQSQKLRTEKLLLKLWLVVLVVLSVTFPETLFFGYVLPVMIILPVMNSLRIIIEHADANPENPFNQSTFYETGIVSRAVFLWDSGDCHIVHHIFPRIPWYQVGKAVDLMKSVFEQHGAVKRTSFWRLVKGWYFSNYAHRSLWPADT